jgi:hypothetical protein
LHVLYNVKNYGALKRNKTLYKRFGIHKSVVSSLSHVSISQPAKETPWLDGPDAVEKMKQHESWPTFSPEVQGEMLQWPERGYMIVELLFVNEVDQINLELEGILRDKTLDFDYTNSRIMNAWEASPSVRKIVHHPEMIRQLSFLLGKKVTPFQTINFFKGSEQETHSDFIHMTTEPKGFLIAAWIALEDIGADQGPLHYYPGSHKLPYVLGDSFEHSSTSWAVGDDLYANFEKKIHEEVVENKLEKHIFHAKKGDVLFWHANLLHGGEVVNDPSSSRKSLVIHFFCEGDVLCYHEITQRPAIIKEI